MSTMEQCLFTGEINTENSSIPILYAGGAVGNVNSNSASIVKLEEISTNSVLYAGTLETTQLYAGGLVAKANKVEITYSTSWGRIIPITSDSATQIYVGGMIGSIEGGENNEKAYVNNSYTSSSVVADSIADSSIANLNIGALVGKIPDGSNIDNIKFSNVFYSSDYALFADENYVKDKKDKDVPLGSNLSAQALLLNDTWHINLKTEGEATPPYS